MLFLLLIMVVALIWVKAIHLHFEVKDQRRELIRSLDDSIDRAIKKMNK